MVDLNIDLPEGFLDEEVRCGYTVTREMKKVWAVELDLLSEFMRVCEKYQLKWWVNAGTLLGTIRHKGMIPWDDDIDVAMMSEDYEQLCRIASDEFRHPYFFQTEETDPGSIRGHAQLRNSETTGILKRELKQKFPFNQGIFLDIFPLYAIPDDDELYHRQMANIRKYKHKARKYRDLKNKNYHFEHEKNILKAVANYIGHILAKSVMPQYFDYRIPYAKYQNEVKKYDDKKYERVSVVFFAQDLPRRIWKRSWFDEVEYAPFEMLTVPVPKGYKEFLDVFYGNWHECVRGTSTHGDCVFDTDRPYTEYMK